MMDARVLIIGGGFAGARSAQDLLRRGFRNVTLVDRKDYFEVTYATLRGVTEPEQWESRIRKAYRDFIKGHFIQGEVSELSAQRASLADGRSLDFDYAIISSGRAYEGLPIVRSQASLAMEERNREVRKAHAEICAAQAILLIGGGPVGVEYAGELAEAFPDKHIELVHSGSRLLPSFPKKVGSSAKKQLEALGVELHLNQRLVKTAEGGYASESGDRNYAADLVYFCGGGAPHTAFLQTHFASSLDAQGSIRVDEALRVEGSPHIFAIGDCNNVPEEKLGYLADVQGAFVAKTLQRIVQGKNPQRYSVCKSPLALITVGSNTGVAQMPCFVTSLKIFVKIKQKDLFIAHTFRGLGAAHPDAEHRQVRQSS